MQTAQVTVAYVNEPQKNPNYGSIKSADGIYYGVHKSKLHLFNKGQTYNIVYTTNEKGYHSFKEFVGGPSLSVFVPASTNTPAAPGYAANGSNRDEHIFVCGVVNNAIRAGTLPLGVSEIAHAVRVARSAYKSGFTSGLDEELPDDHIPF